MCVCLLSIFCVDCVLTLPCDMARPMTQEIDEFGTATGFGMTPVAKRGRQHSKCNCNWSCQRNSPGKLELTCSPAKNSFETPPRSSNISPASPSCSSCCSSMTSSIRQCHICNSNYAKYSPYSLSQCPYSLALGPFDHTRLPPVGRRSRQAQEDLDRNLIMILVVIAILIFLIFTYFGSMLVIRILNRDRRI